MRESFKLLSTSCGMNMLRKSNVNYLTALMISVIGSQFFLYSGYGEPVLAGQSLSIVFTFLALPVIFFLWLLAPVRDMRLTKFRIVLILFISLWVISVLRTFIDDGSLNYTFITAPLLLAMVYVKPPVQQEAERIALIAVLLLAATMFAVQIMDVLNYRPFRESIKLRWIPALAGDFRWEGMFGDPNNAGFIAAFIYVYGLTVKSLWKWPLILLAVAVLILSESRSALLAAVIGSLTLLALQPKFQGLFSSKWTYRGVLLGTVFIVLVIVIAIDPTFNGRVPIWFASVEVLHSNFLVGIGTPGFESAAQSGDIPWRNSDGHSILIDTLVRLGVLPFLLVVLSVALSLWLCWGIRESDKGRSFAILVTFLIGALTYTLVGWSYFGVQILPWLIALFLANGILTKSDKALVR